MTFKSVLSATGNGLLTATTAIANASTQTRIWEIDAEIAKLQEERATLVARKF
jgi:hypothetical protein